MGGAGGAAQGRAGGCGPLAAAAWLPAAGRGRQRRCRRARAWGRAATGWRAVGPAALAAFLAVLLKPLPCLPACHAAYKAETKEKARKKTEAAAASKKRKAAAGGGGGGDAAADGEQQQQAEAMDAS